MKKWLLVISIVYNVTAQTDKTLNEIFANALISDVKNNILRTDPIKIISVDESGFRIKTNYDKLDELSVLATNKLPWFITQGEEGSTIVEIKAIDTSSGWITLGETYAGVFNRDDGETIEFFNPFVNYEIIKNKPLLEPYPKYIEDDYIRYIQSGGILKRGENDYVLLTPVVFGAHKKRALYYATSKNLEDWTFHKQKLLSTDQIPFAKKEGNVFSTDNPFELDDSRFLVLLGVEKPDGQYAPAYMIIDKALTMVQAPQQIKINNWDGPSQNCYPLALTYYDGLYRLLFHKKGKTNLESEIHEIITPNLIETLNTNNGILSSTCIHKALGESGYLRGKADDASYVIYNSYLYILLGSEESPSEYLTSLNREYGLIKLDGSDWVHDKRSPLLVNPVGVHEKYPEYSWASDHLGGFISPIFKDNFLYLFLSFGTDNPDYLISGIRIKTY